MDWADIVRSKAVVAANKHKRTAVRAQKTGLGIALGGAAGEVLFPDMPFEIVITGGLALVGAAALARAIGKGDRTKDGKLRCPTCRRAVDSCSCS